VIPILHNYSNSAGRTLNWDTSDNKESYEKNLANPKTRQILADLGFLYQPIEYKFNSHGFRTAEFDHQFDVVCFGCSFTMGTGIHAENTWPELLSALTGLQIANLGHAGSSNDTAFRFAEHYLKFLRPRYAIWLQTDMNRIELLDEVSSVSLNIISTDTKNPCCNDYFIKTWFSSESNQYLNLQKNTLAFEQLCSSLNIKSIILTRDQISSGPAGSADLARDLMHPGVAIYKTLAQQVKNMLTGPTTGQSL